MTKVNLDALIVREDFEIEDKIQHGKMKDTLSIEDLKPDSFFYSALRKPDFQRETSEWDTNKICEFIDSFLEGDLIPAIILWRSSCGYLFVIDGSHRISALSAWINNDYGDGPISKRFYDGIIPDEQILVAEATRNRINKRIGSYDDYRLAISHPDNVKESIAQKSKLLGGLAIQLQWVDGDVQKAENSFFKINQQAAPINSTEITLLKSRKKPNCIAARAIIKSGKGHKYWAHFTKENQERIQDIAKEINSLLFTPKLETPVKTLDLPIGGKIYTSAALPLVLELINISNSVSKETSDDVDGTKTISFLQQTLKTVRIINSNHPSSLGLHPIVYLYSQDGRHKVASFYSIALFVKELEEKKMLNRFIEKRETFEKILVKYEYFIQQILRKYRSATSAFVYIKEFYFELLEKINDTCTIDGVISEIIKSEKYSYLTLQVEKEIVSSSDFSKERKSAVYIKEALHSAPKCKICGGYIHRNSISIDHIVRKQDGGLGSVENGQLSHPYCNTGFKN
ncbi:MAG: DUF262 domain-containing protein [Candidatus Cloacimonetes bacterium]|nr:DUF262 domain-containing protein [Candidatus Cloacimonadota bacterium]